MDRRAFIKSGLVATAAFTTLGSELWKRAFASHPTPVVGPGPYGPLSAVPDANRLRLPAGFTSRVIATTGEPVPGTNYPWHSAPDGAATFAAPDGGWILVSNSESPAPLGGASAIRFNAAGEVDDAYRILTGSSINCAGGPTPWGTWLSCEEFFSGMVWECDPTGVLPAVPRPAMGSFAHEAAAVDPVLGHVYLTEDENDGLFYRFTPDAEGDLLTGRLEAAKVSPTGGVTWALVPSPTGLDAPTRAQVPGAMKFRGGEGAWFDAQARTVYFTTKGDNKVWAYHPDGATLEQFFDGNVPGSPLNGVDNITVSPGQEIFLCEDHSSAPHQLVMLSPSEGGPVVVSPFFELVGHTGSELAGACFNPAGDRLYFSSQRALGGAVGLGVGITYEITGPFRR